MARSRSAKEGDLDALVQLITNSKLTVAATSSGLSVTQLQDLRRSAKESNTTVKVAKNRLVKLALSKDERFKESDLSAFSGQLLYAFNPDDEVAPAQALKEFAKANPMLEFVAAVNEEGRVYSAEEVKALADLPTKDQLRGQLVGVIAGPLSGLVGVLSGNLRGLANVLNARAEQLENN